MGSTDKKTGIFIDPQEVVQVTQALDEIINILDETGKNTMRIIKNNPFYFRGRAEKAFKRIYDEESRREFGEYELETPGADLLGKTQDLMQYYKLVGEYCQDCLPVFIELDKKMADILRKRQESHEE